MTGVWTLSLLLVVAGVVSGQDACDGILADTLGHPTDCHHYYNLYQMACPEGQIYNAVYRECGPPGDNECRQTSTGTSTTTAGTTTTTTGTTTSVDPSAIRTKTDVLNEAPQGRERFN